MSESKAPARTAEIGFKVGLDDQQMPVAIEWTATDAPDGSAQETKAIMLSVWDGNEKKAMRIDLWTKDMLVDEMKLFVFQTLMTMADTFERATSDGAMANEMRGFAHGFAEKMGFIREGE
jgi:gliding motility-associated protein GldC